MISSCAVNVRTEEKKRMMMYGLQESRELMIRRQTIAKISLCMQRTLSDVSWLYTNDSPAAAAEAEQERRA